MHRTLGLALGAPQHPPPTPASVGTKLQTPEGARGRILSFPLSFLLSENSMQIEGAEAEGLFVLQGQFFCAFESH